MPTTLRLTQQFQSLAPLLQLHAQCRSFHVCEPRRALGNDPEILSNLPPKLPFPTKPNPSPYEIFHLHSGATQTQIKKRCESMSIGIRAPPRIWMLPTGTLHVTMKLLLILGWMASDLELVRMHHPDSPHTRDIPSSLAQSRFQSIAAAYDLLRNPHLSKPATYRDDDDMYMAEVNRRKAHHARYRGMGVRDWERRQSAMAASVDAGKWSHDRAIVYAFGIFVRVDFPSFVHQLHTQGTRECSPEINFFFFSFLRLSVP